MSEPKYNARQEAAKIVGQCLQKGLFLERLIPADIPDRSFIVEVTHGTVRHKTELEWLARRLSTDPPTDDVMPFIYIGLYQIFMMDNMEDYALVNETVAAVRAAGLKHLTGYTNVILRNALRKKDSLIERLSRQEPAIRYSHPEPLVRRWTAQHGPEKTAGMCKWNNSRPPVTIRVRHSKADIEELSTQISAEGIDATRNGIMPDDCIDLRQGAKIPKLPGFSAGGFMVQDASTLAPVLLLNPQAGEFILDACAAPGGKTIHISDCMGGEGRIIAMDVDHRRLTAVKDNVARTGVQNVQTTRGDATDPKAFRHEKFDGILVDAPCTNTGVLRRRPEAKWRFTKDSLRDAVTTQRSLLDACSTAVKPGGRLVYSVCSIEPEEGEGLIEKWLNSHKDFSLVDSNYIFPMKSDGGYSARLKRKDG